MIAYRLLSFFTIRDNQNYVMIIAETDNQALRTQVLFWGVLGVIPKLPTPPHFQQGHKVN